MARVARVPDCISRFIQAVSHAKTGILVCHVSGMSVMLALIPYVFRTVACVHELLRI